MTNPAGDYSDDAKDFLNDYRKGIQKTDSRLEDHQDVIKDFGENYERAYSLLNTYYAEAYKDMSYFLGNQWSLEELSYLSNQRRSCFTYNKIRRIINLVQGLQRKNRNASIVSPVENASEDTAMLLSDVLQYTMQKNMGYETISDAFKGSLITGLSFVSPYVDYRNDPVNGDIRFHIDDWNAVSFDPFMTKRDLSDCTFVARRKFMGRSDVMSLLPDQRDIIEALPWGTRDDKFTYMPFARQWGLQRLLNYNEYWRQKWEMTDMLVDMESGEMKPWKGTRERIYELRKMFPQLEIVRKPKRTVELGIIVEGELLYYGKDPNGLDEYPMVPFFCTWEPSYDLWTWKIQSMVRILRDPQTEINKRRSKMVDMLDSQLNSGMIVKEGTVSNTSSLYKSGQGQVIFLRPQAQMTDIQRIEPARIDPSMFQLEAEFEKDMLEIAGVNPELFGFPENNNIETAGILTKMRQSAGLVNLEDLFDGLRQSQRLLSEKVVKLIQLNYTPEKIRLITKKEPTPEFYSKVFSQYDISVEETNLTDTQQQAQFAQLMALRSVGVPIPDSMIVENSSLHDKKPMKELFENQAKQAQEQQQMMFQLEAEKLRMANEAVEAKAYSDVSLGKERLNKIGLDAALSSERIARAEEDRTAGALNLVKAVKEIQGMDVEMLHRKVEMIKMLTEEPKEEKATKTTKSK